MAQTYGNFIGGRWLAPDADEGFEDRSPSDLRVVLGRFPRSGAAEVDKAIQAAERALPGWARTPGPSRGRVLLRAHQIFTSRKAELAELMAREEGKIQREALGEIQKGLNLLEYYAGEGLRMEGVTAPSELPSNLLLTLRQPLGVVAVITPWNFPFAIPIWKLAPALVTGNTVVMKPASATPLMAVRIAEVFQEAGLPDGVLNLVFGGGGAVGDPLVDDPRVRAVSFTGSNAVGQRLATRAAGRLAKVTLELGGKNAVVVMDDADLELAAAGVADGAFGSTGQRCTATSRLLVHERVEPKVTELVAQAARSLRVGPSLDPETTLGPVVDETQLEQNLAAVATAIREGAEPVLEGRRVTEGEHAHGLFMTPAIFRRVDPGSTLAQEEVFGPVLAVTTFSDLDEAVALTNRVRFGLTASIYTRNINRALRFVEDAQVGMVHINSPTVGGEAAVPFGGVKASGAGFREMAKEGALFFTEIKTVFIDYTGSRRSGNLY